MYKILVCGSRGFNDYKLLSSALDSINTTNHIDVIVEGGARGADTLAKEYAQERGIEVWEYGADWDRHGKGAGYIRNYEMLDTKPAIVVAFYSGTHTKGTSHMVGASKQAGIPVLEFGLEDE